MSEDLLIRERSIACFQALVGDTLKIAHHMIDSAEPLEKYGIDSIVVVQLTNKLRPIFTDITSTVFFEHRTIDALVSYFLKTRKTPLINFLNAQQVTEGAAGKPGAEAEVRPTRSASRSSRSGNKAEFSNWSFRQRRNRQASQEPVEDAPLEEHQAQAERDIAIIGLSGRYPQAEDIGVFWENLKHGRLCIQEIPEERWDWQRYYSEERGRFGRMYTRWGGFIQDADKFDPLFFSISAREAELMDPQERLFLETAYAGIQDAGYTPAGLCASKKVGVFVGIMNGNYASGVAYWSVANRVSYVMDFHGPSMAVDSACSSSLTAIHLAVESLRAQRCECAIAGGVNLIVHPIHFIRLSAAEMLTPGNECRTFSAQADGFVDGEGVGAVVLKPLRQALRDKDHIYGVIKGSAINAGGRTHGYSVPNPTQQGEAIREALKDAGVGPATIGYVEAHGTGTSLGDPLEVAGLTAAFSTPETEAEAAWCILGSVKMNVGHLESASGIAGLTRVLLQFQHHQIAPSRPVLIANPEIDFTRGPFAIRQTLTPWSPRVVAGRTLPRRAGISSFGAGGANAHLIVEEAPAVAEEYQGRRTTPAVILLSARNDEALGQQVARLLSVLEQGKYLEPQLDSIAWTLQTGREAMEQRLALLAGSMEELKQKLRAALGTPQAQPGIYRGRDASRAKAHAKLAADTPLPMAIEAALTGQDYEKLLTLWVAGAEIDWRQLYSVSTPSRLSLPGYPFAKEHYWLSHARMEQAMAPSLPKTDPAADTLPPLHEKTEQYLKTVLARVTKLPVGRIEAQAPLEKYGIDSLMIRELVRRLESLFPGMPGTIFFEYQDIRALAGYFVRAHREHLIEVLEKEDSAPSCPAVRSDDAIAVIGLAGRYPQADNIDLFWENLRSGKDCITEIPGERWDHRINYDPDKKRPGKIYSKWGGFINDYDKFDARFFNISPREAELLDPQERVFLECAFSTLEDAGYTRQTLSDEYAGRVGVFVGVTYEEYQLYGVEHQCSGNPVALSGTPASIANRVSYYCDFHGPSLAVDSMCSSSLTALHLACQAIHEGDCAFALAGGVNLSLHPNKYLFLSQGKFVSTRGRCASFGAEGDGYVPGEGVGAVLLRPLKAAQADGDHIYAVIKATAVNHGGKTNGYTVPNLTAQTEVICQALAKADISPRAVSYIEAHGTGTALGDPIEIAALSGAFRRTTDEIGFCEIGSVKSNIGHLEAAAGIAGLSKILLQLRHRQLVPSLHAEKINPDIEFGQTPFVIHQELSAWPAPSDGNGTRGRNAGLSSFGAGGANAHVLVAEYLAEEQAAPPDEAGEPQLIVLSAKNDQSLRQRAIQLLESLEQGRYHPRDLPDIAWTLQIGREAMPSRLALLASSPETLGEKLAAFIAGNGNEAGVSHASGKARRQGSLALIDEEDSDGQVDEWLQQKRYDKLSALWVKGGQIDWRRLNRNSTPRRISLPVYPFERKRHWIPAPARQPSGSAGHLHPLVQNNTSTLGGQRFSSVFSGEEFFLAEHQIMGNRVMPGAAWLEMAIAALTASVAGDALANIVLKNVVWSRPLIVNEPGQQVHISVSRTDGQALVYRIYGDATDPSEEATVYGQGGATLSVEATTAAPSRIDIQQVRATCTKSTLSGEACYAQLRAAGMEYGNGHKGIVQLDIGETMLLAKLVLPDALRAGADAYSLHPAILDSALQATAFLTFAQDGTPVALAPSLPFALGELRLNGDCETTMWAVVVSRVSDTGFRTFDIDLCRENGDLCAALRGVATRKLANESDIAAQTTDNMMMAPCWTARDIGREEPLLQYETHCVLLCDATSIRPEEIERVMPGAICLVPEVAWENALGIAEIARRYQQTTIFLFNEIQRRIRAREKGRILIQVLLPSGEEGEIFAGVAALLKTARLENPRILGQVIAPGQEDSGEPTRLLELLKMNAAVPYDGEIRYAAGQRYIRDWEEVVSPPQDDGRQTLSDGAWLITGGAGGLGMIFARYLTRQSGERRIILTGRRTLNDEQRQAIAALGNRVVYRQCDIADSGQVAALTDLIQSDYGELEGILHTAGVIKDNYLINKTEQEFAEVMAPKVAGVANLDAMTERLPPALFILFSSGVSLFGNAGQADYAAANGFMDAFAQYRNHLQARGERRGKTLSVNWPLWAEGGMHIDAEVQKIMEKNTGMTPMKTATGVNALFRATSVSASQIMVLEGDLMRIRRQIASSRVQESPALPPVGQPDKTANVAGESTVEALTQGAIAYLKRLLSGALKLPADQIDEEVMLEEYGIDSIMVTQLTERLEKDFGSLSKTLFFEYRSLAELAGYFVDTHREKLHEHADIATVSVPPRHLNAAPAPVVEAIASVPPAAPLPAPPATDVGHSVAQDIAIIGVQGRYPQADDPQTFWDNLTQGRDCISEIPIERWDHSRYFDASKDAPGKSYSKWGGFINDVDKFDPLFFNISPAEAEFIDPQERLFLQTVWHTLEDAGYRPGAFSGLKVGVYVGVMWGQYQVLEYQMLEQNPEARILVPSFSYASIANRISYVFNFKGPSIALDTMCSSSLTAIHLAAEGIRHKACDVAIAGGVNINVHPGKYAQLSYGRFASSDGRCRSFGADGDGYVPGEGVGAILLKPLMQAEQDGDQIYGVIRASAVNHGGKTNGYTVPNPNAQAELIQEVFAKAELDPATISYVEAHGTGTALGDPIEIRGLAKAFGVREGYAPCAIGSVKSNIGHLESAAGIAAVTKVLLQFKHRALVPSLHAQDLNPNIDFSAVPFRVQRALAYWERPAIVENGVRKTFPRRAGVSAFGAGGSNAHVILEEYVAAEGRGAGGQNEGPYLILLSARDEERLREYAARLLAFITREESAGETESPSLMQELTRIFAGLLHVDRALIDIDAGLGEYDIEPLLLAEFCHQINQKYACRLLPSELVNCASLRALAAYLDECGHVERSETSPGAVAIEAPLRSVAYTLQVGREPMAQRLAIVAAQNIELEHCLRRYLAGENSVEHVFVGNVKKQPSIMTSLMTGEAGNVFIRSLVEGREHDKLASLWVTGAEIDWSSLYHAGTPTRLSLPVYPFEKMRCWLAPVSPPSDAEAQVSRKAAAAGLLLNGQWRPSPARPHPQGNQPIGRWLILCNPPATLPLGRMPDVTVKRLDIDGENSAEVYVSLASELLEVLQHIPESSRTAVQVVLFPLRESESLYGAMAGLLRCAARERWEFQGQVIEFCDEASCNDIEAKLTEDSLCPQDEEIRYQQGIRQVNMLMESAFPTQHKANIPWREGGIYLITGGLGKLGMLLAKDIITRIRQVSVILIGRTPLDADKERTLKTLCSSQVKVSYLQLDVTDGDAVARFFHDLEKEGKNLSGIIHAAGVIEDCRIQQKNQQAFKRVLAPKVNGVWNLDVASHAMPLDFFILFSSIAGRFGNPGQSDYACANAFLDRYAEYRNHLAQQGQRSGKTLSISWPLWHDGGMGADAALRESIAARTGVVPLDAADGLSLLYYCIQQGWVSPIPLPGEAAKIRTLLLEPPAEARQEPAEEIREYAGQGVLKHLLMLLGRQLKVDPDKLDPQEAFSYWGMDSNGMALFNQRLAQQIPQLPTTLLYEHQTPAALANHLERTYPDACRGWRSAELTTLPVLEPTRDDDILTPVAIIGMSARFPHADSPAAFWRKLQQAESCIAMFPTDRWPQESACETAGGYIDGFADFDPQFFNLSPAAAMHIDPQERLFMQECWNAFADAGVVCSALNEAQRKQIGVFGAISKTGFDQWSVGAEGSYATSFSAMVNRFCAFMDFRGPSLPVDTMCSSTLVALHLACDSIRRGEVSVAVVGAVNLFLHPGNFAWLRRGGLISGQSEHSVFGVEKGGFMPSEGVGALVLKSLSQAQRDNDAILAVIRSSAVRHSGRTSGYGIPDPLKQAEVIQQALDRAGLATDAIGHIEMAAAGARMADEIEIAALKKVFQTGKPRDEGAYSAGAVKALLGHGEAFSGMAQLIKTILQIRHQCIFPTRLATPCNPVIHSGELPFVFRETQSEWQPVRQGEPRRAGINSFGAGGVYAHVILEEYQPSVPEPASPHPQGPALFILSAKTPQALRDSLGNWRAYFADTPRADLGAVTWTLQLRREAMRHRFACVAADIDELLQEIDNYLNAGENGNARVGEAARLAADVEVDVVQEYATQRHYLAALGRRWCDGATPDWRGLYPEMHDYRPVSSLPGYPFRRQRYWHYAPSGTPPKPRFTSIDTLMETKSEPIPGTPGPSNIDNKETQHVIGMLLFELLHLDELDSDASFSELGLDSLTAGKLVQRLNTYFGVNMEEMIVFDYPTAITLAAHIDDIILTERHL